MLLVLSLICIAAIVASIIIYNVSKYADESCFVTGVISGIALTACIIASLVIGGIVSEGKVLDQKIELYQEENSKIENNISLVVKEYMEHEDKVFETPTISENNLLYIVAAYPELRSSDLVNSQIELYINNNREIRALKEKKLDISVLKWWLYFGG